MNAVWIHVISDLNIFPIAKYFLCPDQQTYMKITSSTDILIEDLLNATCGSHANAREKFVFREALLGLVRLAKAEQVLEMRRSLGKLIGNSAFAAAHQKTKSRQRNQGHSGQWPQQLEFNQFD